MKSKFITVVMMVACLFVWSPSLSQNQADWDWVNERFFPVLNELLPIEEISGVSLGYQSYRDLYTDELEYSFVFSRFYSDKELKAVVRLPDTVSLYDQIMSHHRNNRFLSIAEIKTQLKMKEWRLSEKTCSPVRTRFEEFYSLMVPIQSAKDSEEQSKGILTITFHPRIHRIKADLSYGSLEFTLADEDHQLVRWAKETRLALQGCIESRPLSIRK